MERVKKVVRTKLENGETGAGAGSVALGVGETLRLVNHDVSDTNLGSASKRAKAFTPPVRGVCLGMGRTPRGKGGGGSKHPREPGCSPSLAQDVRHSPSSVIKGATMPRVSSALQGPRR